LFGAESIALPHRLVATDPSTPVLFIDTRRHFSEALEYRNRLNVHLASGVDHRPRTLPGLHAHRPPGLRDRRIERARRRQVCVLPTVSRS